MNRLITTLVQLMLVVGAVSLFRLMLPMLREDWQEIKNDLRK